MTPWICPHNVIFQLTGDEVASRTISYKLLATGDVIPVDVHQVSADLLSFQQEFAHLMYFTVSLNLQSSVSINNKYVGLPYCRAEMFAGHVTCCPLVSHGEYADGTDRRMPDYALIFPLWSMDASCVIFPGRRR